MADVILKTPYIVEASDYHEFDYIIDFLNRFEAKPQLSWYGNKDGETDWFINGEYTAILYVKGEDDLEAKKLFNELHASQI